MKTRAGPPGGPVQPLETEGGKNEKEKMKEHTLQSRGNHHEKNGQATSQQQQQRQHSERLANGESGAFDAAKTTTPNTPFSSNGQVGAACAQQLDNEGQAAPQQQQQHRDPERLALNGESGVCDAAATTTPNTPLSNQGQVGTASAQFLEQAEKASFLFFVGVSSDVDALYEDERLFGQDENEDEVLLFGEVFDTCGQVLFSACAALLVHLSENLPGLHRRIRAALQAARCRIRHLLVLLKDACGQERNKNKKKRCFHRCQEMEKKFEAFENCGEELLSIIPCFDPFTTHLSAFFFSFAEKEFGVTLSVSLSLLTLWCPERGEEDEEEADEWDDEEEAWR